MTVDEVLNRMEQGERLRWVPRAMFCDGVQSDVDRVMWDLRIGQDIVDEDIVASLMGHPLLREQAKEPVTVDCPADDVEYHVTEYRLK